MVVTGGFDVDNRGVNVDGAAGGAGCPQDGPQGRDCMGGPTAGEPSVEGGPVLLDPHGARVNVGPHASASRATRSQSANQTSESGVWAATCATSSQ